MELYKIINAKEAIEKLVNYRFANFKTSFEIMKLEKYMNEQLNFYSSEYKKLIQAYAKKDATGKIIFGERKEIMFENEEDRKKFNDENTKLLMTNLDAKAPEQIKLTASDFVDKMPLTPNEMMTVEPFILWD